MAKRTTELIQETKRDFSRMQEELESARQVRDKYQSQLDSARRSLRDREKSNYPNLVAQSFIESLKKGNTVETVLIGAIDSAIKKNIEFDDRTYKIYLYRVANDKSIYKYITNGSGWETRLDLQIVFESVAGRLTDWAEGIENYREVVLHSKGLDNEKRGKRATEFWYENVYGYPLHDKTISGRLSVTPFGLAPFWEILDKGSQPLASDRPGGYNPVPSKPTDFIGSAERTIEKQFLTLMNSEAEKWFQRDKEIREIISQHEEKRNEYSQEINRLKTDIKLNEQIFKSFQDKQQFIDRNILAEAIASMDSEKKFKKKTFNIARQGSGLDILITVKKAEGLIEY